MEKLKNIAIVAHDNRKADMLEWVDWNYTLLSRHQLICTGTTGTKIEQILAKLESPKHPAPPVTKLKSGPLGGDQQLGAKISEGEIDVLIFFWDPMEPHPHDVDVKALLRIAVVYNIPIACNRSSADFIISSPLLETNYMPKMKDYTTYIERNV
jgi:methylglyoxal synthase